MALTAQVVYAQPLLTTSTDLATAGYFQLSWENSYSGSSYQLQQSAVASFSNNKTLYQGSDTASFLSGLSNGTYYFRVLDNQGNVSNIVTVTVAHHSLKQAFSFFALGGLMFIILVIVLLTANRTKEAS